MNPLFFASQETFRAWLEKHHRCAQKLWVGFRKKASSKPSITWPEAVDQALCFGWIDGLRKSIDETSYAIRFTPRKPRSAWSTINIKRVRALTESGHMQPAALKAFQLLKSEKSAIYSYEQRKPPNWKLCKKSDFAATKRRGIFSRRKRRGIDGPPPFGSSARKRKRPARGDCRS